MERTEDTYQVSDDLAELISEGLDYSELSKGAFDIAIEPLTSLWAVSYTHLDVYKRQVQTSGCSLIALPSTRIGSNAWIPRRCSVCLLYTSPHRYEP